MERAGHPSRSQVEALLEFLQRNPSLAKGFSKVPSARDTARRSWEALALQLNSLGGCVKTSKQWIKYWADKKSAVRKKCALQSRARNQTRGVAAEVVEMTEVEEKIVYLMGGESFSTGDRHLAINPFETSANTSQGQVTIQASQESISLQDIVPLPLVEISHRVVAPSPPHPQPRAIESASPPLPSGSGAHPLRRNNHRRSSRSPIIGPSPIKTLTNRRSQRRYAVAPPSERQSQVLRMTERILTIEEQRMEVDRRTLLLMEAIVNHTRERDNATTQALLAIGEGLKLLAEAIKK